MKKIQGVLATALNLVALGTMVATTAIADDKGKTSSPVLTFWTIPKEASAIIVLELGVDAQKTIAVTPATIVEGTCADCMLPMKFKTSDAAKTCAVCGCGVSNAQCIAGKPIKGTWGAMFIGLPRGVALRPTYNAADNPESGIKTIIVDRHIVFLPVEGLNTQTPVQLATLVKQIGGAKPKLLNGGKHLTFTIKEEWTQATETKFENALSKISAKIVQPEQIPKTQ